jgi:hypothetical protein
VKESSRPAGRVRPIFLDREFALAGTWAPVMMAAMDEELIAFLKARLDAD